MSRHDIVVFGATGSTGRHIARYLDRAAARGFSWAIAGRNAGALADLQRSLGTRPEPIVADAHDDRALRAIAGGARVVISAVGPFASNGEPLLRACAQAGVDYVDVAGETAFVRRMIDRYHDIAVRSGARIVPLCGFDSVPSDLGVLLVSEYFRERGTVLREAKGYFQYAGGFNAGTAASTLELWRRPADVDAMRDPVLLNPYDRRTDADRRGNDDPTVPVADADLGRWVAPFFMGPINTRVVRRSAALRGESFHYQEYWDPNTPLAFFPALAASFGIAAYQAMSRAPVLAEWMRPIASLELPRPAATAAYFRAQFLGRADDGATVWAEIADRGDPATEVTAKIVAEAALALAIDRASLPAGAGMLTPATAFGSALVDRLRAVGVVVRCPACRG